MMYRDDPDEPLDEWLSRVDPDPDMLYESWRERRADEEWTWRRLMGVGVMSTNGDEP